MGSGSCNRTTRSVPFDNMTIRSVSYSLLLQPLCLSALHTVLQELGTASTAAAVTTAAEPPAGTSSKSAGKRKRRAPSRHRAWRSSQSSRSRSRSPQKSSSGSGSSVSTTSSDDVAQRCDSATLPSVDPPAALASRSAAEPSVAVGTSSSTVSPMLVDELPIPVNVSATATASSLATGTSVSLTHFVLDSALVARSMDTSDAEEVPTVDPSSSYGQIPLYRDSTDTGALLGPGNGGTAVSEEDVMHTGSGSDSKHAGATNPDKDQDTGEDEDDFALVIPTVAPETVPIRLPDIARPSAPLGNASTVAIESKRELAASPRLPSVAVIPEHVAKRKSPQRFSASAGQSTSTISAPSSMVADRVPASETKIRHSVVLYRPGAMRASLQVQHKRLASGRIMRRTLRTKSTPADSALSVEIRIPDVWDFDQVNSSKGSRNSSGSSSAVDATVPSEIKQTQHDDQHVSFKPATTADVEQVAGRKACSSVGFVVLAAEFGVFLVCRIGGRCCL